MKMIRKQKHRYNIAFLSVVFPFIFLEFVASCPLSFCFHWDTIKTLSFFFSKNVCTCGEIWERAAQKYEATVSLVGKYIYIYM